VSSPELTVARQAAREAGAIIAQKFRGELQISGKESFNLVTEVDLASERAIAETIRRAFPTHAILGEELSQADLDAPDLWVIDPLDGTNNYAHGLEQFAVSIGYYRQGRPHCGVVHQPTRDEWYWAEAGGGSFAETRGRDGSRAVRSLRVSNAERLDQALVGCGFFYDRGAMMEATLATIGDLFRAKIHGIRRFGAASLDLCYVASGALDGFFEFELAPWDFGAARLILTEAGGRIGDCFGGELGIGRSTVLASNGPLHAPLLEVVRRHVPQR